MRPWAAINWGYTVSIQVNSICYLPLRLSSTPIGLNWSFVDNRVYLLSSRLREIVIHAVLETAFKSTGVDLRIIDFIPHFFGVTACVQGIRPSAAVATFCVTAADGTFDLNVTDLDRCTEIVGQSQRKFFCCRPFRYKYF
jgi:hypothetical protein